MLRQGLAHHPQVGEVLQKFVFVDVILQLKQMLGTMFHYECGRKAGPFQKRGDLYMITIFSRPTLSKVRW